STRRRPAGHGESAWESPTVVGSPSTQASAGTRTWLPEWTAEEGRKPDRGFTRGQLWPATSVLPTAGHTYGSKCPAWTTSVPSNRSIYVPPSSPTPIRGVISAPGRYDATTNAPSIPAWDCSVCAAWAY